MTTHAAPSPRRSGLASRRAPAALKKPVPFENGSTTSAATTDTSAAANNNANRNASKPNSATLAPWDSGKRTVKKLGLSKALTIPEGTTISDSCRRMGARRVDSVLLTDANGLLSSIVTDKDIATRVIAEGLSPQRTPVSKIMTRNPLFVMSDALAIEALQKWSKFTAAEYSREEIDEVRSELAECIQDHIYE